MSESPETTERQVVIAVVRTGGSRASVVNGGSSPTPPMLRNG